MKQLDIGTVRASCERLEAYRRGKSRLDARISDEVEWWQTRYAVGGKEGDSQKIPRPVSAWLFNSVCQKHADICERMPTCVALPREAGDVEDAATLSKILPVIAERCCLSQTYADNAWVKLKHGVAAYGVFWNPSLENGMGDIDICRVDVRNLFWEPGVTDLQESPHLYLVGVEDTSALLARYPQLVDSDSALQSGQSQGYGTGGSYLSRLEESWPYDRRSDVSGGMNGGIPRGKTAVVDWYYKKIQPDGRTVLHYAKLVGDTVLYASEQDPLYAECGWYAHGQYPFVLDILYPEEESPAGYGLIAVGRNPQGYIDELDGHILEYANWASRVRYWAKRSLGVNEKDFLNPDKRIIEVEGDMDQEKLRQITLSPMDSLLTNIRQMKIDELKETTGTRDVNQGVTTGGVTAAAAITALQEAGDKSSRDCIAESYRAYVLIMRQVVELIRQFYDVPRCFRITGASTGASIGATTGPSFNVGEKPAYDYLLFSNRILQDKAMQPAADGTQTYRRPVFDIDVRAERERPLERLERNDLMLSLFQAGIFDADRREAALLALSGMHFDGVEALCVAMRAAAGGDVRSSSNSNARALTPDAHTLSPDLGT